MANAIPYSHVRGGQDSVSTLSHGKVLTTGTPIRGLVVQFYYTALFIFFNQKNVLPRIFLFSRPILSARFLVENQEQRPLIHQHVLTL